MGTAQFVTWRAECPDCGAKENAETTDRWFAPPMESFITSVEPGTGRVAATCKACDKPVEPHVAIANIHA